MADQINLVPLDQLIEKADQVYKKLVAAESKIDSLSKKKLTISFSDEFRKGARALDELARALKVFYNITDLNVKASVAVIEDLIKTVNALDISFNDAKFDSKNFNQLVKTLERLLSLKVGSGGSAKLAAVVRNVTMIIEQLSALSTKTTNLDDIERITRAFKTVGLGLKTLLDIVSSQKIDSKKIKEIATIYGALGATLQIISGLVRRLPGSESFAGLATIFQKLGQGLSNLVRATRGFTVKDARNIVVIFGGLTAVLTLVSAALSKLPGGDAFERFARSINLLGTGLSGLARATKATNLKGAVGTTLKIYIQVLRGLGSALKGFKNATFPDIGGIMVGIAEGLEVISRLDPKSLKNIQPVFKEFVKGLNELKKVKLDERFASRVAKVFGSLQGALESSSQVKDAGFGAGNLLGLNFERGLRLSIKDQVIANLLASAIKFAARELNPVALLNRIKDFQLGVFRVVDQISAKIREIGQTFINVGNQIKTAGFNLINNFGIGKLLQSDAFDAAVGFDRLSTQVQVFGNLTDEELKKAQDFANEIGIAYPLSSNEALDATLKLIKAGQDLSSVQFILPSAADLAALSDSGSIDEATNALIQAQATFREFADGVPATFQNIAQAANILSAGADLSTASVESLTAGLANVGPIASQFGLSMDETVAVLATFEDSGLRGAEAGTSLKSLLTQLNTDRARNQLRRLGVTLTDQATGKFRDFNAIILDIQKAIDKPITTVSIPGASPQDRARLEQAQKVLASAQRNLLLWNDGLAAGSDDEEKRNKKLAEFNRQIAQATGIIDDITGSQTASNQIVTQSNRTQEEQVRIIKELFGAYGQVGGSILLANDGFQDLLNSMNEVNPASERAQELMNNFSGDVEQLRGSVETLLTKAFLPMIQRGFRPLVQLGRKVVDFILHLPDPVIEIASAFIFLASALATFVGGALVAIGFLTQFAGVILTVVGAVGSLLISGGSLVIGVAGLAAAFGTIVVVGTVIVTTLTAISAIINDVYYLISNNIGGTGDTFNKVREQIVGIKDAFFAILGVAGEVVKFFTKGLFGDEDKKAHALSVFLFRLNTGFQNIKFSLQGLLALVTTFRDFLTLPQRIIKADKDFETLSGISGFSASILDSMGDGTKVLEVFDKQLESLANKSFIKRIFGEDVTPEKLRSFFISVRRELTDFANSLQLTGKGILNFLTGNDRNQAAKDIQNGLGGIISQALRGLGKVLAKRGITLGEDFFSSIISFKAGDLRGGIDSLVQEIFNQIKKLIVAHRSIIADVATQIFSFLLPGGFLIRVLKLLGLDQVANVIGAPLQALVNLFRTSINTILDIVSGKSLEEAVFGNFGSGASAALRALKGVITFIDRFVGIVARLIFLLFGGQDAGQVGNNIITQVFNSVADVFETLDRVVLTPLNDHLLLIVFTAQRALSDVGNFVRSVGELLGKIVAPIGTLLQKAFSGQAFTFQDIVSAIVQSLQIAFQEIPKFLGGILVDIGRTVGSRFLERLGHELIQGDFPALFTTVGTALVSLISRAVEKIPELIGTALVNLGTFVGSPFLTKLGTDILAGEYGEALTTAANAFIDLIGQVIAKVPDLIGTTLVNIGQLIGSSFLIELGTQISNGQFEDALGTAAYNFGLLVGKIIVKVGETLGSVVTTIGTTIGNAFVSVLGTQITEGDFSGVLPQAADALGGLIGKAAQLVGETLGNFLLGVGDATGSSYLQELGRQLKEADFEVDLVSLGQTLANLVIDAIGRIPDLITESGKLLGSPVIEKLGTDVKNGDWGYVIVDIAEGLRDIIQGAFALVPDLLKTAGLTLDIPALTLGGTALGFALDRISTSLGTLVALPIETIGQVVQLIKNIIDAFSRLPDIVKLALGALTFTGLALAIKAVAGNLGLLSTVLNFFRLNIPIIGPAIYKFFQLTLPVALNAARTAFTKLLLPAAKIILILDILKNAISGINVLLEGGTVGQAFGDFLAGVASDILGFLGIDFPKEQILAQLNQVLAGVQVTILAISLKIQEGVQSIFDKMLVSLLDVLSHLTIFGGLVQEGFQVDYFKIADAFNPDRAAEFVGNKFWERLGSVIQHPANLGLVQAQLRQRWGELWGTFTNTDLATIAKENPADLGAIFDTMVSAGGGIEASTYILRNFGIDVFKKAFEEGAKYAPEVVSGIDLTAFGSELARKVATGEVSLGEAQEIILQIASVRADVTPEQAQAYIDDVTKQVNELAGLLAGKTPAEGGGVDVPVDPNVVVPDNIVTDADAQKIVDETASQLKTAFLTLEPTPIFVPTNVTPQTTPGAPVQGPGPVPIGAGLTVPADSTTAIVFADALSNLRDKVQEILDLAPTFGEQTATMITNIQGLAAGVLDLKTNVDENIPGTQESVTTFLQTMSDYLAPAILGVDELRLGFNTLAIQIGITTAIASVGFVTFSAAVIIWANVTTSQVKRVTSAVEDLNSKLQSTLDKLAAIGANQAAQDAGGVNVSGGGAYGVSTFPGGVFRVLERGQSELFTEGGKTYLLSARRGEVIPLPFGAGVGSAPPQPLQGPIAAGQGAGNGLTINEGPIQISLNGLTRENAQPILDQARSMIREELNTRNNNIRSRMRTGHR